MKSFKYRPSSKRISQELTKRQHIIIAGAFLVAPFCFALTAHAQSQVEQEVKSPQLSLAQASPLLLAEKENKLKLEHVNNTYQVKSDLIQRKLDELDQTKRKNSGLDKTKRTLKEEIADMKAEIADMKRRVAEKKALEAQQAELEAQRLEAISHVAPSAPTPSARGQSSSNVGNRYTPGQCTYYVYERRPDIGSFWGNANQWIYSAQADGYATGSTPSAGAIAVSRYETHVAYVESVSGNNVTISEMNYGSPWAMNTRTVPASHFMYIY